MTSLRDGRVDFVVGIGASAGGLQALEEFFAHVNPDGDASYVVVQHLSPDHRSMMPELLGRRSLLPVAEATDGAQIRRGEVLVLPPAHGIVVRDERIALVPRRPHPMGHWPIDEFFESMAEGFGDRAVAVVLTGTGSDGARGVGLVRDSGGIVMAQDPATCAFDGMPRAALATGAVSVVGTPTELAEAVGRLGTEVDDGEDEPTSGPIGAMARIIELVRDESGVDFLHYKKSTVERRITRRATMTGHRDLSRYGDTVAASVEERMALCRDLFIGVTRFFRDPEAWDRLRREVLVPAFSDPARHEFRAWVAGCSTGEEAYTLAMCIKEVQDELGAGDIVVKIFATDVDSGAIARASAGTFEARALQPIDPALRRRYFFRDGDRFTAGNELRRMVLFTPHDLTSNPPFARLDLVTCRNVLIYMDPVLQRRVLGAIRFGLVPDGALFLGPSEHPGDSDVFAPIPEMPAMFRAVGERARPAWILDRATERLGPMAHPSARAELEQDESLVHLVRQASSILTETLTPPAAMVDGLGRVRHLFGAVQEFLQVRSGTSEMNLLEMTTPAVSSVIGAGLGRALQDGEAWLFSGVSEESDGTQISVRITPVPPHHPGATVALVSFERSNRPDPGLRSVEIDRDASVRLEQLTAELQRVQASRQQLVEEISAANEELQATNEELQATNEELHSVNAEHERQIIQLHEVQADLDSLMAATEIGTVFLDEQLHIRRFTPSVTEFLPLLPVDVGRPITDLALSIDPNFADDLRAVLAGAPIRERSLDTMHGPILVRVLPYHVRESGGLVVTFTDVSCVRRNYELALRVLDSLPAQVAFVGFDGTISMVNAAWDRVAIESGTDLAVTGVGANYFAACEHDDFGRETAEKIRQVMLGELTDYTAEYPCDNGEERWFALKVTAPSTGGAVVAHFDVTEQKHAERLLRDLSVKDHLTGVLNRRGLDAHLAAEIERSGDGGALAAIMVDCDDFKRINDRLGHSGGDLVLATVARRIAGVLRPNDCLARIGGDEFLVLLPGAAAADAGLIADRVRLAVGAEPVSVAHGDLDLTVSAAIVDVDGAVRTLEQLLDRCRFALRRSKVDGKNRVSVSQRGEVDPLRTEAPSGDRAAILGRDDSFSVAAQPIVRLADRVTVGFELLTRHVAPPFTPPAALFRVAMEEGLLAALDEQCLRRALAASAGIDPTMRCHVNLYPSTLLQLTPERILDLFAPIDRVGFCIELSEQQILADPTSLVPHRRALAAAGVEMAVDDVGFGRTSLETLVVLEPELIKIDVAFVRGVSRDADRQRALGRLVRASASLGATVVAEGVEDEADACVVADLGIEFAQGFHLGRPAGLETWATVS